MTTTEQLKYSYWAFIISIITTSLVQISAVQLFAMVFSTAMIIAFYVLRKKTDKESFEHQEFSNIIKTFWVWSALFAIGVLIAGAVVSSFADMTALHQLRDSIMQGSTPDEESMKQVTQEFTDANWTLMLTSSLLSILPAQIYAILRIKQGLSRLANPPVTPPEAIIG